MRIWERCIKVFLLIPGTSLMQLLFSCGWNIFLFSFASSWCWSNESNGKSKALTSRWYRFYLKWVLLLIFDILRSLLYKYTVGSFTNLLILLHLNGYVMDLNGCIRIKIVPRTFFQNGTTVCGNYLLDAQFFDIQEKYYFKTTFSYI